VATGAQVEIHTGSWEHDLAQAELVPAALSKCNGSGGGSGGSGGGVRAGAYTRPPLSST